MKRLKAALICLVLFLFFSTPCLAMDVTLAWDANTETDLAGYKVYYGRVQGGPYNGYGSSEGPSPIIVPLSSLLNPAGPQVTVHGLPDGANYLVVTAYDGEGLESGYSNEVSTQASEPTPQPAPTNSAPVLSSLEVNGRSGATSVETSDRLVDIRIVASDDVMVSQYLILDGASDPGGKTFLPIPGGAKQNPIFTVNDFPLNDRDGSHAIYAWVKDDQGVVSAVASKTNVLLERLPAIVGFPSVNRGDSSITVTFSEGNMQQAALSSSYSFNNGLMLSGNGSDISGENRIFKLPLMPETLQANLIYTLQISNAVKDSTGNPVTPSSIRINDDDNDGMADDWEKTWFGSLTAKNGSVDSDGDGLSDGNEYSAARSNPLWGGSRWSLSPLSGDSDGDGIPDRHEVSQGLNPTSASDRDLDLDNDGWTNYEEYAQGFAANDPASHPQGSVEIAEVIPLDNSGVLPDTTRIPANTAVGVRLESKFGIDTGDPDAVNLTISDGERSYTRRLNDRNAMGQVVVRPIALDTEGAVSRSLWVTYYRTKETEMAGLFPNGGTVEVTVQATDARGNPMDPAYFCFRIEDEETGLEAKTRAPNTTVRDNTPTPSKKTLSVQDGLLKGAQIIYDRALREEIGFEPEFGPLDEVPEAPGNGLPMNMQPPAVFPNPVTLLIPCPEDQDPDKLAVYYFDGKAWWLACDRDGHVTAEGDGWMVPGSRINHFREQGRPAYVEVQIHHFSGAAVGDPGGTSGTIVESRSSCFIATLLD